MSAYIALFERFPRITYHSHIMCEQYSLLQVSRCLRSRRIRYLAVSSAIFIMVWQNLYTTV